MTSFREHFRRGFTLIELLVTTALLVLLLGYAWKIYFGGRETTRHTLNQSQLQSKSRIFLERLDRDIASAYSFYEFNSAENRFGFYCFKYARTPTDWIYYSKVDGKPIKPSEQEIYVLKIEYSMKDGKVRRRQWPGSLKFQMDPAVFTPSPPSSSPEPGNSVSDFVILQDIQAFEFKPYRQSFSEDGSGVTITPLQDSGASGTTFITLRLHNKIDKVGDRRDEELDLVIKLFSRVKLAEAAYPKYFSSTDQNGWY